MVLIVAKCNVNKCGEMVKLEWKNVLIVAKCNVNSSGNSVGDSEKNSINSSKV